jgi:photosystem II stability/assembly factor-like uncharacterized protein
MNGARRLLAFMAFVPFFTTPAKTQKWEVMTSGSDTNLRGVSVTADGRGSTVVWASGSKGVVLVSLDAGKTWNRRTVKGGEKLDFRGIVPFDGRSAYLMASGEGEKSGIYKTSDGGLTWRMQVTDRRKEFFLDAIACLSPLECYALGDPMDGKFVLLQTKDGERWERLVADGLQALPQEGAFAASNSCLSVRRDTGIYFVTGGPAARVFHSTDMGRTWQTTKLPLPEGKASSGAFSIAVNGKNVVVVGGDYRDTDVAAGSAAYSSDDGATWKSPIEKPGGFRSSVADDGLRFISVGTNGSDISRDSGNHWRPVDGTNLNAVTAAGQLGVWGAGPNGTVTRLGKSE